MIGDAVRWGNHVGTVTKVENAYAYIRGEDGATYRVSEAKLRDAQAWERQEYDEKTGEPMGSAFTDHKRTVEKRQEQPKTVTVEQRKPTPGLFRNFHAVLGLDDLIADSAMRGNE
jgi:hypothetical protein